MSSDTPEAKGSGDFIRRTVGWLVVMDGPGTGTAHPLGEGANSVGSAPGADVVLAFGDKAIDADQASIVYDSRSRMFIIRPGSGRDLTYIGGAPLLNMMTLETDQDIAIGETKLKLVRFCGPDFDWSDLD